MGEMTAVFHSSGMLSTEVIESCEDYLTHFSTFVCKVLQYPWQCLSQVLLLYLASGSAIFLLFQSSVTNTLSTISGKGEMPLFEINTNSMLQYLVLLGFLL